MGRLYRVAATVLMLGVLLAIPVQGADPNVLKNGSFEDGFVDGVGKGWTAFSNGGKCRAIWRGDNWKPVVWDGQWSQLISIQTGGDADIEPNRYAGIYQAVNVVSGSTYHLSLHGMVRSTEGSPATSGYGYRLQWAIDYNGGTDWKALDAGAWKELNWYEWPTSSTGYLESFAADVKATSGKMTLFLRAWKKWGTNNQEGDFDLDGISLVGSAAGEQPESPSSEPLPPTGFSLFGPLMGLALGVLAIGAGALRVRRVRR